MSLSLDYTRRQFLIADVPLTPLFFSAENVAYVSRAVVEIVYSLTEDTVGEMLPDELYVMMQEYYSNRVYILYREKWASLPLSLQLQTMNKGVIDLGVVRTIDGLTSMANAIRIHNAPRDRGVFGESVSRDDTIMSQFGEGRDDRWDESLAPHIPVVVTISADRSIGRAMNTPYDHAVHQQVRSKKRRRR